MLSRIQGRIWVLEHHLQLRAHALFLFSGKLLHILSLIKQPAARRLFQADQLSAHRRFAAAGFAHQTEGFSLCNRKGNAVHRMHIACRMGNNAAPDGIIFFQVFYPDQRLLLRVFFFHIYAHLHVSPSLASIHLTKCPSPICL